MKIRDKRHGPQQIVRKLLAAKVMLTNGKSNEEVLKVLEISEGNLMSVPPGIRASVDL